MKILHIQAQLPAKTGSGVYFSNVIKGFSHQNNACIYGCFEGFQYDLLPKNKQYPVVFPNADCPFPLPGMSDIMPYDSTIYGTMTPEMIADWQRVFSRTVQQAIAEFQPDVIFCHHLWFLTALVCAQTPAQIPIYAFCHGTDLRQARQHPDLCAQYVTHLDRLTGVFALSHPQIEALQSVFEIPKAKITVVGGGFDPDIFYPGPAKQKATIDLIYAGKISAAKGVFALAKVFDHLSQHYPQAVLHLVGHANEAAKQVLQPYLDNPNLKLYNVPNQKALADLFRQCDLFVLPSYYEGLGLVSIEALACRLRVVVTEIPALKEQLGPRVNDSGVITYVALPQLKNQDTPVAEDLPLFYDRLEGALQTQIEAILHHVAVSKDVDAAILNNSWPKLIHKIEAVLKS